MAQKFFAGLLIGLGLALLVLGLSGIALTWIYRAPLTQAALMRLQATDSELEVAQTTLADAKIELERTLRLVESTEKTMAAMKDQLAQAKMLAGSMNDTLDKQLIPGLEASRDSITNIKKMLTDLRASVAQLNALPFLNFKLPGDEMLSSLISVTNSLDGEIARVQQLAQSASIFAGDASYLMGGDLGETRKSLENFLAVVNDYNGKLSSWRAQLAGLIQSLPAWVDAGAVILTIFLLWFSLSQVSIILHGFSLWRGVDVTISLRDALKAMRAKFS